jgi:hypothetical protein
MVDRSVVRDVSSQLVDTIMENRWRLDQISLRECAAQLSGVDEHILRYTLGTLSAQDGGGTAGEDVWALDYASIARSVAQKLFRQRLADLGEVSSKQ